MTHLTDKARATGEQNKNRSFISERRAFDDEKRSSAYTPG